MRTTHNAGYAINAWRQGQRRRVAIGVADRVADGMLAAGGVVLVNAVTSLGFGLPGGHAGIALGTSTLGAAMAWMARVRRGRGPSWQSARAERLRIPMPARARATARVERAA